MKPDLKIIATSLAVILIVSLVVPTAAFASILPSDTIPTKATITGSGSPPIIKALWELPDTDFDVPGTQVDIVPSGIRDVVVYIVVTDPNGRDDIAQVFANVFDPYGNLKEQVHAEWLDPHDPTDEIEIKEAKIHAEFSETGTWTTNLPEMLLDPNLPPVPAEPITLDVEREINEEIFDTETAYMYRAIIPMEYCQIWGNYTVEAWATDGAGNQSFRLSSWFLWIPTQVLELDFNAIDFGEIVPCVEKMVPGDYVMDPLGPAPSVMPTVKNEGNVHLAITLHATPLVGVNEGKEITKFDAKLKDRKTYFNACEPTELAKPLKLCETEKISFSVHADVGTPVDTYIGSMTMSIGPAPAKDPKVIDKDTTFYGVFVGRDGAGGVSEAEAEDMRDALVNQGWAAANTKLLNNLTPGMPDEPTKANIEEAINELKNKAKSCDEFVFYFAGHGGHAADADGDERDGDGDETLVVADGGITDDELTEWLAGFEECVSIVVILNCCYAGGFVDGANDLQSLMTCNNSMAVLMATKDGQQPAYSTKGCTTDDHAFTQGLLDGLAKVGATSKADAITGNNDGITTAKELFDHAKPSTMDKDGDGQNGEDPCDGADNDNDGKTDEDPPQEPRFREIKCPCDP